MTDPEPVNEDLVDFARSLAYGSRSDLSFKYLARLDAAGVGDTLAGILLEVGAVFDTGDPTALIDLAVALQAEAYASRPLNERYHYDTGPFSPPGRTVAESHVALVASSGHFAAGDDPGPLGVAAMEQEEAEARIDEFLREAPVLSEVPVGIDPPSLRVRHGGYDVRGALSDRNVAFPIDRLREMEADGVVASLHATAYSFVGACAQGRLVKETIPEWLPRLEATGSDVILLVPV